MPFELDETETRALLAAIPGLLDGRADATLTRLYDRLREAPQRRELEPLQNTHNLGGNSLTLADKENVFKTPPRRIITNSRVLLSPAALRAGTNDSLPLFHHLSPTPESSAPALLPRGSTLLPAFMLVAPSPTRLATPPPRLQIPPASLLSPLQLGRGLSSSPTPTPPPSPTSAGSKRTAAQAGLEDAPRRSNRIRAAGSSQADAAGAPRVARVAGPSCPRGANRKRVSRKTRRAQLAGSVEAMQAELLRQESSRPKGTGKGRGGRAKKTSETVWTVGDPPKITRDCGLRVVGLGMVPLSVRLRNKLSALLLDLSSPAPPDQEMPTEPSPPPSLFVSAMTTCAALEKKSVTVDFELLLSYIEAAFYIQWRYKHNKLTHAELAREVPDKAIDSVAIHNWLSYGTRLAYLAAASSAYILPLIAVCSLKYKITKEDWVDLIQELGFILSCPHQPDFEHVLSKDCGQIIRDLIVPQMVWIKQMSTHLDSAFSLHFPPNSPPSDGEAPETICFNEVSRMTQKLRSLDTNFFALPPQDPCWDALQNSLLAPTLPLLVESSDLSDDCVADEIVLKTKFKLRRTACPVKPENSVDWTETERKKLKKAVVAENIEDLGDELDNFYDENGDRKDEENYLCIAPEIADGRVLTIRGDEDELVAMVVTNIAETLPHLEDTALTMMSAILEGEVYEVDSSEPDYEYCASHKVVWNRYPEKGEGAPQDVHPYFVRKEGVKHFNFSQRSPLCSQEMKEEPEETEQLAEFIQLITVIIEMHLKKYLTKEYNYVRVYATRLPLNERSRAHPFGGFVINIAVSTRGHRDAGDKLFCVVIPFGKWEGGELGLYEAGLSFRLRPWDAIIFPSCNFTHFNQHFKGIRLSLVLHSDKQGDEWIRFQNHWASRD